MSRAGKAEVAQRIDEVTDLLINRVPYRAICAYAEKRWGIGERQACACIAKAKEANNGADTIMVCERGASFGYNNLVSDMRSLAIMRETTCPVVFDATHPEGRRGQPHRAARSCLGLI